MYVYHCIYLSQPHTPLFVTHTQDNVDQLDCGDGEGAPSAAPASAGGERLFDREFGRFNGKLRDTEVVSARCGDGGGDAIQRVVCGILQTRRSFPFLKTSECGFPERNIFYSATSSS